MPTNKGQDNRQDQIDRFVISYGAFVLLWSRFEYSMEVLIWETKTVFLKQNTNRLDNCREINTLTAGEKIRKLVSLLRKAQRQDLIDVVNKVYRAADRNGWIHSRVFSTGYTTDILVRFRVDKQKRVHYDVLDIYKSHFKAFGDAMKELEEIVKKVFGFDLLYEDDYILRIMLEQKAEDENRSNPESIP